MCITTHRSTKEHTTLESVVLELNQPFF